MYLRLLIPGFLLTLLFHAKVSAAPQYAFRISFKDKAGADISNPLDFLSQQAIDRRTAQSIAIDSTDVPVFQGYIDSVLDITHGKFHVTSRWLNTLVVLLNDSSDILPLQGKPFINDIKYIAYYPGGLHKGTGGDNKFASEMEPKLPPLKTTGDPVWYSSSWDQTNFVHGDCLHDQGFKGQGILIAVLDDGFQYVDSADPFDSLYSSGRIVDKHNFVLANSVVFNSFSHGTEALSTMAAYDPGNYVGAAPLAQYALYITEDQGSEQPIELDNMVAALERADSMGADVISSSLGYNKFSGPSFPTPDFTYADLDGATTIVAVACNMATSKGILVVISAGNEGGNSWNHILTPGDADSVLTIGSVNGNKVPAGNSGFGPNFAGVIKPDICMLGNPAVVVANGNPFSLSGTSFATPQAAGFAACLLQAYPGRTPYEVKAAIRKSADHFTSPDNHMGYGVPDFCTALLNLDVKDIPGTQGGSWIDIYPNPVKEELNVSIHTEGAQQLVLTLTDITGKLISRYDTQTRAGSSEWKIKLPAGIAPGIYLGKATLGEKQRTIRLVKE